MTVTTDSRCSVEPEPSSPQQATETRFWDRVAEKYARSPVADQASYEKKLEITRQYLRPDMNVFEFGCGTGSTALEHAPHVKHIQATDISTGMLEIARRKAASAGVENVSFEQATIEEIDLPKETMDVVLGMSILHLVRDKEAVIAKVKRTLRPGGVFVSSTVCLGNGRWYLRLVRPVLPVLRLFGLVPRVVFFTREQLEESLVNEGFEIEHSWQPGKGKAVFVVARKP